MYTSTYWRQLGEAVYALDLLYDLDVGSRQRRLMKDTGRSRWN